MTLYSMTGFARSQGTSAEQQWVWELRAVNGKGLDLRFRLPPGFESLERDARKLVGQALHRGNVQLVLSVVTDNQAHRISINETALQAALEAIKRIDDLGATAPSTASSILALKGVMDTSENSFQETLDDQTKAAILDGLNEAVHQLKVHRSAEGKELEAVLSGLVDQIDRLTKRAETDDSSSVNNLAARLKTKLEALTSQTVELDKDRLHQEAALLATRHDVREELDRLKAHVSSARDLIAQGSPVGRKLEFLAQELNREANTLCSKSSSTSLTDIGLELKAAIDQFREQSLNIE